MITSSSRRNRRAFAFAVAWSSIYGLPRIALVPITPLPTMIPLKKGETVEMIAYKLAQHICSNDITSLSRKKLSEAYTNHIYDMQSLFQLTCKVYGKMDH